jgi:hypothetical protein
MRTQQDAQSELWRRGILSWKLHETQKKIYRAIDSSPKSLFVALCSRQLGKSYLMVVRAIEQALRLPNARIKYGTAFLSDLQEFIIPTFNLILSDCPSWLVPKYNVQQSKFIFKNGSEIKLVGLDMKPNGLRGNTIDLIILDEAAFINNLRYLYDSVIVPATIHRRKCKIVLITTPPVSPDHDFVEFYQKAENEGSSVKFTIHDNPMLTKGRIEELCKEAGGEDSSTWKREYMCIFCVDTSLAIVPEWRDDFIQSIERDEYFKYYYRYEAMDIGTVDLTACLYGYYDFKRAKLIIEDETHISGPEMTTDALAKLIRQKESDLDYDKIYLRISDNNNLILLQDLSYLHKMPFSPTLKDDLQAMVNEVRLWVSQGRILIHPRCKMLIGNLKYGLFNKKRSEFERSKIYGHYDHLAALIYLVRNVNQHTNPIPTYLGKRFDVIDNNSSSDTEVTLGKLFGPKLGRRNYAVLGC